MHSNNQLKIWELAQKKTWIPRMESHCYIYTCDGYDSRHTNAKKENTVWWRPSDHPQVTSQQRMNMKKPKAKYRPRLDWACEPPKTRIMSDIAFFRVDLLIRTSNGKSWFVNGNAYRKHDSTNQEIDKIDPIRLTTRLMVRLTMIDWSH